MGKCYVKAYYDWIEQTAALSDAERGRLFIAILEYARSGLDPKLDGREGLLFPVFRTMVDRDAQKSRANTNNIKQRWAKDRAETDTNEYEEIRSDTNEYEAIPTKDIRHKTQDTRHKTNTPPNNPPASGGPRDVFAEFAGENADLLAALRDYSAMRVKLKKPMTDRAKQLAIGKLRELSGEDPAEMIRILEQSIANSWQGLFPLRDAQQAQKPWKQKTAARDAEPDRLDPLVMKAIQRAVNGGNADGNA